MCIETGIGPFALLGEHAPGVVERMISRLEEDRRKERRGELQNKLRGRR